ncbi:hypothetical protein EDB96_4307 [Flavobacterium sp. S87F.05.LMB.W.Kidney.N]|nr:hypothetical protein EDB96_4307 [Flavobacterium sp. S87F.05.LMB.W.Kidney.N]
MTGNNILTQFAMYYLSTVYEHIFLTYPNSIMQFFKNIILSINV